MATSIEIPVTVEPEAAAFVAEKGLQKELEQFLTHARQTIRGLHALAVVREYCPEDDFGVVIEATTTVPELEGLKMEEEWGQWKLAHFGPDILRYMGGIFIFGVVP